MVSNGDGEETDVRFRAPGQDTVRCRNF
jgi:hypothetical protein